MDSKQIGLTVLVSLVVALIVSLFFSSANVRYSPPDSGNQTNQTNTTLPDLITESLNYRVIGKEEMNQTNGTIMYKVETTATVKNIGMAPAGFSYALFNIFNNGYATYRLGYVPRLNPGQSAQTQVFLSAPAGRYNLVAVADHFNQVKESNENNNFANISIVVEEPYASMPSFAY